MSDQDNALLLVYVTVPDKDTALKLARELILLKLAAGANVAGPVHSFYRWRGEVCEAQEWQIFAQTSAGAFAAMREWLVARHPHQTPCIIAVQIASGHEPFLAWIAENTSGANGCA